MLTFVEIVTLYFLQFNILYEGKERPAQTKLMTPRSIRQLWISANFSKNHYVHQGNRWVRLMKKKKLPKISWHYTLYLLTRIFLTKLKCFSFISKPNLISFLTHIALPQSRVWTFRCKCILNIKYAGMVRADSVWSVHPQVCHFHAHGEIRVQILHGQRRHHTQGI